MESCKQENEWQWNNNERLASVQNSWPEISIKSWGNPKKFGKELGLCNWQKNFFKNLKIWNRQKISLWTLSYWQIKWRRREPDWKKSWFLELIDWRNVWKVNTWVYKACRNIEKGKLIIKLIKISLKIKKTS